jgi:hypothetical protein
LKKVIILNFRVESLLNFNLLLSQFIPQNFRPNLNKNKVPAPGFRQATQSRPPKNKIVEEISNLSAENRGNLQSILLQLLKG